MKRKPREVVFHRWVHTMEQEEWCSPFLGKFCHPDATGIELPVRTWPTRRCAQIAVATNCYGKKVRVRKCEVIVREVLPPRRRK